MIHFERKVMSNGLTVIAHEDHSTPLAVFNILYKVGSRNEEPSQTGFAHLFEHFMFEGSENIPDFDSELEMAGGENNAFTTNDYTNYYEQIPAENIETAFWLESDRMKNLAFDQESLETQKRVVCEEFKEHYINQPYGDLWHTLSALAYQTHPYQWPVIGKELAHIEHAQMPQLRQFFAHYYNPKNAILVVAGKVNSTSIFALTEKWFGDIATTDFVPKEIATEPEQMEERRAVLKDDVPANAIYKAYKMFSRLDPLYYAADLIRDLLSTGDSARLYRKLVKEKNLFSNISAYLSETIDEGLFIIEGKLHEGVTFAEAEREIENCIAEMKNSISDEEFQKVKNKMEAYLAFSDTNVLNRATNLAFFEFLGNANRINEEINNYQKVSQEELLFCLEHIFQKEKCTTVEYHMQ